MEFSRGLILQTSAKYRRSDPKNVSNRVLMSDIAKDIQCLWLVLSYYHQDENSVTVFFRGRKHHGMILYLLVFTISGHWREEINLLYEYSLPRPYFPTSHYYSYMGF